MLKTPDRLRQGSFHDLDLGQGPRQIWCPRDEIWECAGVRDGKDRELSGDAGDCGDSAESDCEAEVAEMALCSDCAKPEQFRKAI